jgi:hypothetical protein
MTHSLRNSRYLYIFQPLDVSYNFNLSISVGIYITCTSCWDTVHHAPFIFVAGYRWRQLGCQCLGTTISHPIILSRLRYTNVQYIVIILGNSAQVFLFHLLRKQRNTCVGFTMTKSRKKCVRKVCVGKSDGNFYLVIVNKIVYKCFVQLGRENHVLKTKCK